MPDSTRLTPSQQALVEQNIGLVHHLVRRYFAAWRTSHDDLISEGYLALCRASQMFDPKRGCLFSTYASRAIFRGVNRFLHQRIKFPALLSIDLLSPVDEPGYTRYEACHDVEVISQRLPDGWFSDMLASAGGETYQEIGDRRGVTRQRIAQRIRDGFKLAREVVW